MITIQMPWLGKTNVTLIWKSSPGSMPESIGKWSDGVGHRSSMTMRKFLIGDSYKHMMRR